MANAKLDTLDYKILKMLSIDARKPYLEVARACGVSGAAIHQRIQKLYSMGVVRGSITLIDPSSVGFDTCAYVGIFLNDSSKYDEVIAHLKEMPEVVECYITTGKYDMFVKLYAKNIRLFKNSRHSISENSSSLLVIAQKVQKTV